MMNRITVSVDEELEQYLDEKSEEYGNRSRVVREALKRMRKAEMVRSMREHFSEESRTDADAVEEGQIESWSDLPDYE